MKRNLKLVVFSLISRPSRPSFHDPSRSKTEDLEVLFEAAGASARPGAVKYMEFITYLWSEDEAARARGLWEDAIRKARESATRTTF